MSVRSRWIALACAACGLLLAAGCTLRDDEIAACVHGEYWRPSIAGEASITKASKVGSATPMSLRRDLGLDQDNSAVGGVDVDLGRQRFSFEYLDMSLHGSTITPETFIFHAKTYPQGDRVSSELDCPTARLNWEYALWQDGPSVWRAGLGARLWTFNMKVADPTAGLNERRHFSQVFPLVASDAVFDLGGLGSFAKGLFAEAGGSVAALSSPQEVFEFTAALGYGASHWSTQLGWRFLRYDFNESTNDGDFNLSGPFVAIRFTF